MSQRRLVTTKWFFCLLVLYALPVWSPVGSVTVRSPPKDPTTVEAQAKFFQDFFSVQLSPYKIEFGHVCEDPNTWEQRYEKKDFKNHRDMGKVRWGDKDGGYGEHYWDLNHAGNAGNLNDNYYNEGEDDSFNHDHDQVNEPYEEPSEVSPTYGNSEYDPEKESKHEESGRTKRANLRVNAQRKPKREYKHEDQYQKRPRKQSRRNKEVLQTAASQNVEKFADEEAEGEVYRKPSKQKRLKNRQTNQEQVTAEHNVQEQPIQHLSKGHRDSSQFLPYERGAGVREHQPEVTPAASAPRLFLEPSTGHVVDRTTGKAYVLQPIPLSNN